MRLDLPLSAKGRAALRRTGQKLKPSVHVGKGGISPELIQATNEILAAHELIKVRVLRESPVTRDEAASRLEEETRAECPGKIGHTFLLYRPKPDPEDSGGD